MFEALKSTFCLPDCLVCLLWMIFSLFFSTTELSSTFASLCFWETVWPQRQDFHLVGGVSQRFLSDFAFELAAKHLRVLGPRTAVFRCLVCLLWMVFTLFFTTTELSSTFASLCFWERVWPQRQDFHLFPLRSVSEISGFSFRTSLYYPMQNIKNTSFRKKLTIS